MRNSQELRTYMQKEPLTNNKPSIILHNDNQPSIGFYQIIPLSSSFEEVKKVFACLEKETLEMLAEAQRGD